MGRRKLFNGPLSLILTLITLLFMVSFVVGQTSAPGPKDVAKTPENPKADDPETKSKAPAKAKKSKTKNEKKGKDAKKEVKVVKVNPPKVPTPPVAPPATPPPATDPKLVEECNECWTSKRSELSACKGISNEDFAGFNDQPSSPKVASCLCIFADNIQLIFNDTCGAVCVDQNFVTDIATQATQFKTIYKCDPKGNSVLGANNNLVAGNQTASAISNNINGSNMYLGLSFALGMVSFLFFT